MNLSESKRAQAAMTYFKEGYNCAQATFLAYNDLLDISLEDAAKLSSSFGGGMGRLREVCGGLTGTFMVAGMLYGYTDVNDKEQKAAHYERIQHLAMRFKEVFGADSYICRDLLDLPITGADNPNPRDRTTAYYNERPCERLVGIGAAVLEEYMETHPLR